MDERTKDFGDYVSRVVCRHKVPDDEIVRKHFSPREKAAMSSLSGATGGYLIPKSLLIGMDEVLEEYGLFHGHAFNVDMPTAIMDFPSVDLSASHSTNTSPILGGMDFAWTQEGAAKTESEPSFADMQLVAKELTGLVLVSKQLINDGGETLGKYLNQLLGRAVSHFVEFACFQGTGLGQPLGVVGAPGTKSVSRNAGNDVKLVDLASMVEALLPACHPRAVWACCPSAFLKISQLSTFFVNAGFDSEGGLFHNGLRGVLFGAPLFVTEKLPDLGSTGDVVFFDPSFYVLGRRELRIDYSEHYKFSTNQGAFLVVWRGDGRPLVKNTVTYADGSTTGGCCVALAA